LMCRNSSCGLILLSISSNYGMWSFVYFVFICVPMKRSRFCCGQRFCGQLNPVNVVTFSSCRPDLILELSYLMKLITIYKVKTL
jgi:hypothetical protein